ncbi:sugar nucleotide-binding protein, partial [bacterium]|nr:sugar nucleotide-binding protein [bacterium]
DDQWGSPTWVFTFARVLLDLMAAGVEGVVHAACAGETTWHGLARETLRLAGRDAKVERISTASLGLAARRPARTPLAETRWASWGVCPPPPWEWSLASFFGLRPPGQEPAPQMGRTGIWRGGQDS